jgi:23S rRNA (cytosine1962-C5)-methyltransferase
MPTLPKIILKKGREKPLLRGHPWVFSGAVAKIEGDVSPGDVGEVYSKEGQFLGVGHLNPRSQIILRLLTQKREPIGLPFFKERISKAVALRERWLRGKSNAYRIVNGEGDFLPGLMTDRIEMEEYGCRFRVDVKRGQKTGFYLDQRENRFSLKELSEGKRVLDCFCYTGAFSVHAGMGNAKELTLIDSSEEALAMAEEHLDLNHLGHIPHLLIRGDAFEMMRSLEPGYDIVILDPPPFARKKGHLPGASRGYKDLNLLAFRLLKKEGLLFTFSCSHHLSWDLFQKIIFSAAVDAKREVQLLGRRGHPIDHPVNLYHPEGEYLKGLVCRVL